MINIDINEKYAPQINSHLIESAVRATLQNQSLGEGAELTVVISDDSQLHELNLKFRNIDAPTDVLSFPGEYIDPENDSPYLGDVIISFQRAKDQANNGGHSIMAEIQLLVVHGVLHLVGHDHITQTELEKMWFLQKQILHQLGLDNLKIPSGE